MFEYAVVAGGIQHWWTGQMIPFWETMRSSPYFWPGVLTAALLFILATRQIIK